MKEILIGVIILGIIGGGAYYWYTNGQANLPIEPAITSMATTTPLADGTYNLDDIKTVANWEGHKTILTNWIDQGTIKIASGTATVSTSTLTNVSFKFDMNSIVATANGKNSGFDGLAKHLKSEDFFNAAKFPTSTFAADNLQLNLATSAEQTVTGQLTVRGVTKDVTIPVVISNEEGGLVITGKAVVDRTLFGIKFGSDKFFKELGDNVIADNFSLTFKVYLSK